ncbi:MAG: type transport system permease protein [Acidobacteriota bacterium]|jgi:ABC-2 type transport system permease protein|nr:type transport system permease protein [Acidobacteriota bacterium]MDT7807615.1 type transport system permease protein [Acidobacteriota bacterium]
MRKFRAVVKREYVQRVRSRMFLVVTIGAPLMFALFTVVPILIAGIKSGGPTRIAVLDETDGGMFERVRDSLTSGGVKADVEDEGEADANAQRAMNQNNRARMEKAAKASEPGYVVERVETGGRTPEELRAQLNERVKREELDAYLVLPPDVLAGGETQFFARNLGDVFTRGQVKDALVSAVRDARLDERGIKPDVMRAVNLPVKMRTARAGSVGGEEDKGQGFYLVFGVGFVIYLTILMYGQVILGAVIEEKETRIAEILFSSIRSFPLMLGKLIGVSLVALTQFAIWGLAFVGLGTYFAARGVAVSIPHVPPGVFAYTVLFFLLGYFIYATIYALVGSIVTTSQEGGQLAMPIILLLVVGFYMAFPVIRSPNSPFAFWVSLIPFFAPITMLIRIVTQTPPLWQIALSLGLGFTTVGLLLWLTSRVYRVGMLMYGKRATIPEVLKWIRQP